MTQAKCVSPENPVASKKCKFHVKREGIEMHHWKCAILKLKCDQRQCEVVLTLTTVGLFSGTVPAAWRAQRFQLLGSLLGAPCCTWLWLSQPSGKAVSLPILILLLCFLHKSFTGQLYPFGLQCCTQLEFLTDVLGLEMHCSKWTGSV